MKVEVYHKLGTRTFDADIINVDETESGGLRIEHLTVDTDGSLVPQGSYGYARGWWFTYEEIEMPSEDVKARITAAADRAEEKEAAESMRLGKR